jgi:hypothetical protein
VLENCTPGSVRGTAGNRRSYRAAPQVKSLVATWSRFRNSDETAVAIYNKFVLANKGIKH